MYAVFAEIVLAIWLLSSCAVEPSREEFDALPAIVIATAEQIASLEVMPNKYVVLFKSMEGLNRVEFANYGEENSFFAGFLAEKHHYDYGVKDVRMISAVELPMFDSSSVAIDFSWQKDRIEAQAVGIISEITFSANEVARTYLEQWYANGEIYFAEPVYVSIPNEKTFKTLAIEYEKSVDFNWWHKEVKLIKALQLIASNNKDDSDKDIFKSLGSITNPPVIAVFDSGIDYEHIALKNNMFKRKKGESQLWCGADFNGCNTTHAPKGFLGSGKNSYPWGTKGAGKICPKSVASCSHGTHVAGIIAADLSTQGNSGVAGACPVCKILNIRVLSGIPKPNSKKGGVTDTSILNGLKYIQQLVRTGTNIRVINASIGKFHRSRSVYLLIENLRKKVSEDIQGVLVIAAAGNEDTIARNYPAALDGVIAVSATNDDSKKSYFSNYGIWVDIAAPGGGVRKEIKSTVPNNIYAESAGTSMSAPVVSGLTGLMHAVVKAKYSAEQMEAIIRRYSNEVKLYCMDVNAYSVYKSNKYKKKQYDEECPSRAEEKYFIEFKGEAEKIPLLGIGMVDIESMLVGLQCSAEIDSKGRVIENEYCQRINQLYKHKLNLKRVDLLTCGSVQGSKGSLALMLLSVVFLLAIVVRHRDV